MRWRVSLYANLGIHAVSLGIDLNDDEAPTKIVDFAVERFGGVDVLINNAGINRRGPMLEATRQDFEGSGGSTTNGVMSWPKQPLV